MTIPNKPSPGDPIKPFISESDMWASILDIVSAWNNGSIATTDQLRGAREKGAIIGRNNLIGAATQAGRLYNLTNMHQVQSGGDKALYRLAAKQPVFDIENPVWQQKMDNIVLAYRDMLVDVTGPVRGQQYVIANTDNPGNYDPSAGMQYAFIDPTQPNKIVISTSGWYRVVGVFNPQGDVVLDTYDAQPLWRFQLSEDQGSQPLAAGILKDLAGDNYYSPTTFTFPSSITNSPSGTTGTCINVGNVFFVIAVDDVDEPPPPWVRFTTLAKIVDRVVNVKVDQIIGAILHPSDHPTKPNQPIIRGDTITMNDPTNMWGEIEANATGTGYYRTTPAGFDNRWEIETCSLPINRIRGKIQNCLKYTDLQASVIFGSAAALPVPDFILSGYTNCDMPPEVVEAGGNDYSITANNTFKLDSFTNAIVTIARKTDVEPSDPENLTVPKTGSATASQWEIVEVFEQKARWTEWEYASGVSLLKSYWEGGNPALCGTPVLNLTLLQHCLNSGDTVIACYRPEQDDYIGISSDSAMLGEGTDTQVVTAVQWDGTACDVNYTYQVFKLHCPGTTNVTTLGLPFEDVKIDPELSQFGTEICLSTTTRKMLVCGPGDRDFVCIDICPILCECPEVYSKPEVCLPPPCDQIKCVWEWQGGNAPVGDWVQIITCPEQNPDCECEDQNPPPFDGTEQNGDKFERNCVPLPRACCNEPTGAEEVTALTGSGGSVAFELANKGTFQVTGSCTAQINGMTATVSDPGDGTTDTCVANVTATFGWSDLAQDCLWSISIESCELPSGSTPVVNFTVAGCNGGECISAPGDCGNIPLNTGTFEVSWNGSCTDPGVGGLVALTGKVGGREATLISDPEMSSLGTSFQLANPDLFKGCSCKKDVIAVMNRWTPGEVSLNKIERVVKTMTAKNKELNAEDLTELIRAHCNDKN
jgi:hypothetical protein